MQFAPLTRNGGLSHQPVNPQPVNIDIEIGQERRIRPGHLEGRDPLQHHRLRGGGSDIDMVGKVGKRPPVKLDHGGAQELPAGIKGRHPDQAGLPIERTFNPPDLDPQAIGEGHARQLPRHEIAPRSGVEARQQQTNQNYQAQQCQSQPPAQVWPPRRGGLFRFGRSRVHQKACPIET